MKSFAICYGEQAINVSNSYCSNHSIHHPYASSSSSSSSLSKNPTVQNAVTCIYKVKLPSSNTLQYFVVRITWSKSNTEGFTIGICDHPFSSSELKNNSKVITRKRGRFKGFDSVVSLRNTEVVWDLYKAKYGSGPEPVSGFYLAVLVDSEACLILGDMGVGIGDVEARKRVSEFSLVSRSEHFLGDSVLSTAAKFRDAGACHNITIRCGGDDRNHPALSVDVDRKNVIQVKRLKWNFRGNQTIFVDGVLVDLMWDVHDWLFRPRLGYGLFMFRTRSGFDSRLWLEDKNFEQKELDKIGFSLLVLVCRNSSD
ncbi:uncharacterized protein LOC127251401 [Andrographis paniculata]|uniref:uncharacterized protein LOC127251401 n=1 Tax=Andrographis paniculata TaxID=175694 RepID=UPI0021E7FA56|nr:uncharacterized protein LOC127251401 [Andrographis paniculata]